MSEYLVRLPSGESVRVDSEDLYVATSFPWSKHDTGNGFYASCLIQGRRIYLHRRITGDQKGTVTHHWDGDWTNCTRINLRVCSDLENSRGFRKRATKYPSRFRGVGFYKRDQKWRAQIMVNYRQLFLGYFSDESAAARAYDFAARKHFGEFASLNFP
jgi:hypothetical protein